MFRKIVPISCEPNPAAVVKMENVTHEWQLNLEYATQSKFGKFNSKHPREYASLFANLEKVIGLLNSGAKIGGFQIGFFKSEGNELYRIGQTSVANAKESRLYVHPDAKKQMMYILGIGTKESQSADISDTKDLIHKIKKQGESK